LLFYPPSFSGAASVFVRGGLNLKLVETKSLKKKGALLVIGTAKKSAHIYCAA